MSYTFRTKGMAKKRTVTALLIIGAVMVLLAVFTNWQNRHKPLPARANVMVLSGQAVVVRAETDERVPCKAGQTCSLQAGDQVQTGDESQARLSFPGGETVDLESKTRLTVLELYQAALSRALVATLALHEGKTLTQIGQALPEEGRLVLETSVASIQARGAAFQCDVVSKSQVWVAVYEGAVTISMGPQSVDLFAGQGLRAQLGGKLSPVAIAISPNIRATAAPQAGKNTPTLTDREKTLFPPVLTPTRPGDDMQTYIVQKGDTLYSIARQFGVSWEAIWQANRQILPKPEALQPGQQLRIPKP